MISRYSIGRIRRNPTANWSAILPRVLSALPLSLPHHQREPAAGEIAWRRCVRSVAVHRHGPSRDSVSFLTGVSERRRRRERNGSREREIRKIPRKGERSGWRERPRRAVNIRTHAYRHSAAEAECSRGEGPCANHPEELLEPWWAHQIPAGERASEQVILARVNGTSPGSRSRGETRDSSGRRGAPLGKK